jgi:hypothetical protein
VSYNIRGFRHTGVRRDLSVSRWTELKVQVGGVNHCDSHFHLYGGDIPWFDDQVKKYGPVICWKTRDLYVPSLNIPEVVIRFTMIMGVRFNRGCKGLGFAVGDGDKEAAAEAARVRRSGLPSFLG